MTGRAAKMLTGLSSPPWEPTFQGPAPRLQPATVLNVDGVVSVTEQKHEHLIDSGRSYMYVTDTP